MRELMLDCAGEEVARDRGPPAKLAIDNELRHHCRSPHTRREGWKCKDRARRGPGEIDFLGGALNQTQLPADLPEGGESLVQIVPGMNSGDLAPDACLALRHYWIAETGDENAFLK